MKFKKGIDLPYARDVHLAMLSVRLGIPMSQLRKEAMRDISLLGMVIEAENEYQKYESDKREAISNAQRKFR